MEITLNERTYLLPILKKYSKLSEDDLWDLTEVITKPQRAKILYLNTYHKDELLKEMLENIQAFQTKELYAN